MVILSTVPTLASGSGFCFTFFFDRLLRPPTERRVGNSMLFADLVKCDIGDGELLREMRHRLGPDELVKFLAREDSGHDHPLFAVRVPRRPHALVKGLRPDTDPNV